MTGVLFCPDAPTVTEQSGMFVVEVVSGDERFAFALPQIAARVLAHRTMEAVEAREQRQRDAVVPFEEAARQLRREGGQ